MVEEIYIFTVEDIGRLFVSAIPTGFILGCFAMIIGVTICGLVNIFKKV